MRVVKSTEKLLWEQEETKTYVGLTGDAAFNAAMQKLVFGDTHGLSGRWPVPPRPVAPGRCVRRSNSLSWLLQKRRFGRG